MAWSINFSPGKKNKKVSAGDLLARIPLDFQKSKDISEDDEKKFEKTIQIHTDNYIKLIDEKVLSKEKEIMTIWIHPNM